MNDPISSLERQQQDKRSESDLKRLLYSLEQLVRDEDVVICYDETDGFFIGHLKRGKADVYPLYETMANLGVKRDSIADAIKGAIEWSREETSKRYNWRRRI